MNGKSLLFLVVVSVFLGSCGKGPKVVTPPLLNGKSVTLAVFGAEWCGECKADLPILQKKLSERLGAAGIERVKLELWVPTGKTPGTPPSQENADGYLSFLKLNGTARIDGDPTKRPPRWPKFVELFPGISKALPAAVILLSDNSVAKKFAPGSDTFQTDDIVASVAELIQNPQ